MSKTRWIGKTLARSGVYTLQGAKKVGLHFVDGTKYVGRAAVDGTRNFSRGFAEGCHGNEETTGRQNGAKDTPRG